MCMFVITVIIYHRMQTQENKINGAPKLHIKDRKLLNNKTNAWKRTSTNLCWSQSSLWARHHRSPHLDLKMKTSQPSTQTWVTCTKTRTERKKELKEHHTQGPASSK